MEGRYREGNSRIPRLSLLRLTGRSDKKVIHQSGTSGFVLNPREKLEICNFGPLITSEVLCRQERCTHAAVVFVSEIRNRAQHPSVRAFEVCLSDGDLLLFTNVAEHDDAFSVRRHSLAE